VERGVKPRRIDAATRVSLAFLSRWFATLKNPSWHAQPQTQNFADLDAMSGDLLRQHRWNEVLATDSQTQGQGINQQISAALVDRSHDRHRLESFDARAHAPNHFTKTIAVDGLHRASGGVQQPLIAWRRSGFGVFRQRTADKLATLVVKLCSWMVCVSFQ
jgi:hypothetical protein